METTNSVTSKNSLAITSLVVGIFAIAFYLLDGPTWSNCLGMLAIVGGTISLLQVSKRGSNTKWAAITSLVLGLLVIILTLISLLSLVPPQ